MAKHISCDFKCKLNSTTYISNENEIIEHVNVSAKIIVSVKKIIVGILAHVLAGMVSI